MKGMKSVSKKVNKDIFWDYGKTLSYNALFNFIVGNRGGGKSYGFKEWCLKSFKKTKKQFIYLRRTLVELEDSMPSFWYDIQKDYPGEILEVKGYEFYINGELSGYGLNLSTQSKKKSIPYPDVDKIGYDEFLVDTESGERYLKNEVKAFLNFYETVARMRDVRVMFLANSLSMTNPYFAFFKISLPYGSLLCVRDDKLIELVQKEEFIEVKKNTRFGKIIADTEFFDYAVNNKFTLDNHNFIEKKTGYSKHIFNMTYKGIEYGVWADYNNGILYVTDQIDPSSPFNYILSREDHKPNTMLLQSKTKQKYLAYLCEQYLKGNVRFTSINIKNNVTEVISKLL